MRKSTPTSCDLLRGTVGAENNPPLPLRTSAASVVNSFFSCYFEA